METPFTNAAKRGWLFIPVPMTLAFDSVEPKDCAYWRAIGPMTDADPASANPKPSKIDFFPSSMTSAGIASYFVLTMNSATDLVRPGAFGNSAAAGAGDASTRPPVNASADTASELLNKSRRFIKHAPVLSTRFCSFGAAEGKRFLSLRSARGAPGDTNHIGSF